MAGRRRTVTQKPAPFVAWIALSSRGHPAPFLGIAFSRKGLKQDYAEKFSGDLDSAGYRPCKVRVEAL